jgi:hypothetical protein
MPTVRYLVAFPNDARPTVLDGSNNAVLASTCVEYDIGQGGVTYEEVNADDIAAIITYPVGSELFVESSLASDCLDDADETTAARTRIWWRVVVTG